MLHAGNVIIVGTGKLQCERLHNCMRCRQHYNVPRLVSSRGSHLCWIADPSNHAATQPQSGVPTNSQNLIRNAIAYATAGNTTGAYVCLSQARTCPHLL